MTHLAAGSYEIIVAGWILSQGKGECIRIGIKRLVEEKSLNEIDDVIFYTTNIW